MSRPRQEPLSYLCEDMGIAKDLVHKILNSDIYDEVGDPGLAIGWSGILQNKGYIYVVNYSQAGVFTYRGFLSKTAARKCWDHVCDKYEEWYMNREGYEYERGTYLLSPE